MTTVIYKPEAFAACDSRWSIDGREVSNINENKYIIFQAPSSGESFISMACGTHIAIVLHQAMLLKLIDSNQYFTLTSLYADFFELEIDFVFLKLETGELKSTPQEYYPKDKEGGLYVMGTGGIHAGRFYYHSSRVLRKKRRKKPPFLFSNACGIAGALQNAYSQDVASGGKVNKIEWSDGSCTVSTFLPLPNDYREKYLETLVTSMREIHDMYENNNAGNLTQMAGQAQNQNQSQGSSSQARARNNNGSNATKLTTSRVLEQIKLFESL